jgi:hypothetical protein
LHHHGERHAGIRKQVHSALKICVLAQLAGMRRACGESRHCIFELMQFACEPLLGRRHDHRLRRLDLLGRKRCLLSPLRPTLARRPDRRPDHLDEHDNEKEEESGVFQRLARAADFVTSRNTGDPPCPLSISKRRKGRSSYGEILACGRERDPGVLCSTVPSKDSGFMPQWLW